MLLDLCNTQSLDKLGEVRSRTQTGLAIFRDEQSFNDFEDFPVLTTGLQIAGRHKRIHGLAGSPTTSVANPARPPVVAITPSARRATQDEESPVSAGQPLGQEKEQQPPPSAYVSRGSGRPLVVVILCESAPGPTLAYGIRNPDMFLYTVVSLEGWGASVLDEEASGLWSPQELSLTPPTISHGFRTIVRIEKLCIATIHSNLLPYKHAHELFRSYYFTQNFIRDEHLQMNN